MTDGNVKIETARGEFGLAIADGRVRRTGGQHPLKRLEGITYKALQNYCTTHNWLMKPTKTKPHHEGETIE